MSFEAIAVVGQACVLPGALDPDSLWQAVVAEQDLISQVPEGHWRLGRHHAVTDTAAPERTWSDRGGYVTGFGEQFDPEGFAVSAQQIASLDPLFQWVLHGSREALRSAGFDGLRGQPRTGVVLGNLGYPTLSHTRYAERQWLNTSGLLDGNAADLAGLEDLDPLNRFHFGYPAHLIAKALRLDAGGFALDAACASSLYATKLACDRLSDRSADVMVAGAVNRADDLFLHIGFCSLQAMSRSGRSRPFHREADGLVPAEGAAFVVLKRLEDAVRDGDRIRGVIRGVGLSNDGRSGGFLAPSRDGQVRAMSQAYESAEIDPASISLLECHATGTAVGDAVEIESGSEVFRASQDLPIGSLKSNLGHLIAAAGLAGLIKVLQAMEHGVRPATLHAEQPVQALESSPLRILEKAEDWSCDGPRRAGVSAFGFGGNNAHLIVEAWEKQKVSVSAGLSAAPKPIAVVGLEVMSGAGKGEAFASRLREADHSRCGQPLDTIELPVTGLRFPPADLKQALPQQLAILEAVIHATAQTTNLPTQSTAVIVGMSTDSEIARYGARWRLRDWIEAWREAGATLPPGWEEAAADAFVPGLEAAGVIGTMPNIPANRLNAQLDLQGPSFTLGAEELSGLRSLEIATRALRANEIDAAVVGAVDLSCEPIHAQAARASLDEKAQPPPGDAAVALVLKRHDDAVRDGDCILATLVAGQEPGEDAETVTDAAGRVVGRAHAAKALLDVAAAIVALRDRIDLSEPDEPVPSLTTAPRALTVSSRALGVDQPGRIQLLEADAAEPATPMRSRRLVHRFSGTDAAAVRRALDAGQTDGEGDCLVVIAADGEDSYQRGVRAAKRFLDTNPTAGFQRVAPGVAWSTEAFSGQLGFVFGGAAAAYPGLGRDLLLTVPDLARRLARKHPSLARAGDWLRPSRTDLPHDPFAVLGGSTLLSQAHAVLTGEILGLKPDAVLGVSSGETNSIMATGAWRDLDCLFEDIRESGMYTREIAGEYQVVRRAWDLEADAVVDWQAWRLRGPVERVKQAVSAEPHVHLTMINSPVDCVVAGLANACQRILDQVGGHSVPLGHDIVAHAPEMETWRQAWHTIHHRETHPVPGVRFYANAFGGAYEPDTDTIAEALTQQSVMTVDFRRVVEAAWNDGVRIFIEHGPRGLCAGWIDEILEDREHLAVALDRPGDGSGALLDALAQLTAAHVPVTWEALEERWIAEPPRQQEATKGTVTFPAHWPPVELPPLEAARQTKPEEPSLAPLSADPGHSFTSPDFQEPSPVSRHQPTPPPISTAAVAAATPPAMTMEGPKLSVAAQVSEFLAGVSDAHQEYLRQQARTMERIVALRQRASGRLEEPTASLNLIPQVPASETTAPPPEHEPRTALTSSSRSKPDATPAVEMAPPPAKEPVTSRAEGPSLRDQPVGPRLTRRELEVLASDQISKVLGPLFERQDQYPRQVRMPEPPLLLADRVTGIRGEPGSLTKGSIWTETDVRADSWYLHQGHMPAGVMIESGQADLLLISWLGADFENRGERVYRLLGCELTYHGSLPKVGDTLAYDIHVDGYAQHGPVRLFFFHYDCHIGDSPRLSVRHGQAGFFTDEELADSGGILWDAETEGCLPNARLDAPRLLTQRSAFDEDQVRAFSEGRLGDCFGEGFAAADSHVRTPRIQGGPMQLFDEVTHLEVDGGPWKRGYLRAEAHLEDDEWFFDGHFKGDPCMPGTLMFEGCLETMAFYLAGLGFTLDRDGWRFEPVPEETFKLRCRGQVTPGARELIYEVFVEELESGPYPTLTADLLCTVDGLAAFHCKAMKLRLIPAFPLDSRPLLAADAPAESTAELDGLALDSRSIAACCWGRPSEAFGKAYGVFDDTRRCPRLPGPPYLFMSRISSLEAGFNSKTSGGTVEVEYDVPADAWYFSENGARSMPFCVLLEAALQPCGWLASYLGFALDSDEDLFFRNLDGTGTQHHEVLPDAGTLVTRVKSTSASRVGPMTIVGFEVSCFVEDVCVYSMTTSFGFFLGAALSDQVGLPCPEPVRARLEESCDFALNLRSRPARYFDGELRLPGPMLSLLDRVTGYWPTGGEAGLGRVRAELDVDATQWYFKSHFYGDSVQPGSLGIEAMLQALQLFMLEGNVGADIEQPRFEPIATNVATTWKYRGQVLPSQERVVVEAEITDSGQGPDGAFVTARCSLWVDGMRIYEASDLGMRVVSCRDGSRAGEDEVLDPSEDRWLQDHCPTWTVPALAMMSMVDRLAAAARRRAPGRQVVGLEDVRVYRWLSFAEGARRLETHATPRGHDLVEARLLVWEESKERFEPVASGMVRMADDYPLAPQALPRAEATTPQEDPYAAGVLFHGPVYQALRELHLGPDGSSTTLDASPGTIPLGALNQRLLDAATHGIPHDALHQWSERIPADRAAYPVAIPRASFHGPAPVSGEVRCEARFNGFLSDSFPKLTLQLVHDNRVWAEIELVEALFPKGPLGQAEPQSRRAFLEGRRFVADLSLSELDTEETRLTTQQVQQSDWLAGSIARTYQANAHDRSELTRLVAVKEHVATRLQTHPAHIQLEDRDGASVATSPSQPLHDWPISIQQQDTSVVVRDAGAPRLRDEKLREYWRSRLGIGPWLGEDLLISEVHRFVRSVNLGSPDTIERLRERGALFVANHQVGVESMLFSLVAAALVNNTVAVLAKEEHRHSWIGQQIEALFAHPDIAKAPDLLMLVNRDDQLEMLGKLRAQFSRIREGDGSLLVHVEGTRSTSCGQAVSVISSSLVDLAVASEVPIVPVRFSGGLPSEPLKTRLEYPLGFGSQVIWIGQPIEPDELAQQTSAQRRDRVLTALAGLGPDWSQEQPGAGDPDFEQRVKATCAEHGLDETSAVQWLTLREARDPCDETRRFLKGLDSSRDFGADALGQWLATCAQRLI